MSVPGRCLDCRASTSGRFCAQCGQRTSTRRLTVRDLRVDLVAYALSLDDRLRRTVVGLSRRPGSTIRNYVAGQRVSHVNPFKYCLGAIALYVAVTSLLGVEVLPPSIVQAGGNERADAFQAFARSFLARHVDVLLFLSVPLMVPWLRLLFRRSGHNFAEVFAFALYALGHTVLLSTLLTPVGLWNTDVFHGLRQVVRLTYFPWAAVGFFRSGAIAGALKTWLAIVLFVATLVAILSVVLFLFVVPWMRDGG